MTPGMSIEYMMEPGRYFVCKVVEQPHPTHAGKAGLILFDDDSLEGAERTLASIRPETRIAIGGGRVGPIGDAVVGIFDRIKQEWL